MTDETKRSVGNWFDVVFNRNWPIIRQKDRVSAEKASDMEPDDSDVDETHLLKKQAHEYAGETSIHGLKYIGEKERTKFERWV